MDLSSCGNVEMHGIYFFCNKKSVLRSKKDGSWVGEINRSCQSLKRTASDKKS